jgi:hypothetical protein
MTETIKGIIRDTLKKKTEEGTFRWSRTSLTMFTAWIVSISMATFDFFKSGFKYEVFVTFVAVAISSKASDALANRLTNK